MFLTLLQAQFILNSRKPFSGPDLQQDAIHSQFENEFGATGNHREDDQHGGLGNTARTVGVSVGEKVGISEGHDDNFRETSRTLGVTTIDMVGSSEGQDGNLRETVMPVGVTTREAVESSGSGLEETTRTEGVTSREEVGRGEINSDREEGVIHQNKETDQTHLEINKSSIENNHASDHDGLLFIDMSDYPVEDHAVEQAHDSLGDSTDHVIGENVQTTEMHVKPEIDQAIIGEDHLLNIDNIDIPALSIEDPIDPRKADDHFSTAYSDRALESSTDHSSTVATEASHAENLPNQGTKAENTVYHTGQQETTQASLTDLREGLHLEVSHMDQTGDQELTAHNEDQVANHVNATDQLVEVLMERLDNLTAQLHEIKQTVSSGNGILPIQCQLKLYHF